MLSFCGEHLEPMIGNSNRHEWVRMSVGICNVKVRIFSNGVIFNFGINGYFLFLVVEK